MRAGSLTCIAATCAVCSAATLSSADAAAAAAASSRASKDTRGPGLTLIHFSAQHKHFSWVTSGGVSLSVT